MKGIRQYLSFSSIYFCMVHQLRMIFTFVNGYVSNWHISTHIIVSILSLGLPSLNYSLAAPYRESLKIPGLTQWLGTAEDNFSSTALSSYLDKLP